MRSNFTLSVAAIALGFGLVGASAAPLDNISGRADVSAIRPPEGMHLNESGLSALKSKSGRSAMKAAGEQAMTPTMTPQEAANSLLSAPAGVEAVHLAQPPNAAVEGMLSAPLKRTPDESQSLRAPQ